MTNARFLYQNYFWDTTTVLTNSVGSWLTTRPLSFLTSFWRKKVARSTTSAATSGVDVVIDLGSAKSITMVALINPKIFTGGSVTLSAHTSNSWGTPSFGPVTFPAINVNRKLTSHYFAAQNFRWWRIHFPNPGAANEFAELGTVVMGAYFEPTYQLSESFSIARKDPSRVVTAIDGERQSYRLTKFNTLGVLFDSMLEADKDVLQNTMFNAIGTDTPFVFAVDADNLETVHYAYLPDTIDAQYATGTVNMWNVGVEIEEAR